MALTPVGAAGAVGDAPGTVVATVVLVVVVLALVVVKLSERPLPDPSGRATVVSVDPEARALFVDPEGSGT
jgi:hypothetical protein